MSADVLCSTRAGRGAVEGLVAISPLGPLLVFLGPVAGETPGGPLVGVEVTVGIWLICPPVVICKPMPELLMHMDGVCVQSLTSIDLQTHAQITHAYAWCLCVSPSMMGDTDMS